MFMWKPLINLLHSSSFHSSILKALNQINCAVPRNSGIRIWKYILGNIIMYWIESGILFRWNLEIMMKPMRVIGIQRIVMMNFKIFVLQTIPPLLMYFIFFVHMTKHELLYFVYFHHLPCSVFIYCIWKLYIFECYCVVQYE